MFISEKKHRAHLTNQNRLSTEWVLKRSEHLRWKTTIGGTFFNFTYKHTGNKNMTIWKTNCSYSFEFHLKTSTSPWRKLLSELSGHWTLTKVKAMSGDLKNKKYYSLKWKKKLPASHSAAHTHCTTSIRLNLNKHFYPSYSLKLQSVILRAVHAQFLGRQHETSEILHKSRCHLLLCC